MSSIKGEVRFLRCVSGNTLGSDEGFIRKLKEGIPGLREESNVENCDVILAFCPVVSRTGTNIEAALKKLQSLSETKPVVLVVLHLTLNPEANVPDSSRSVNRGNTLTVDCLFEEDRGLLQCYRNQEALDNVRGWIKALGKKQESQNTQTKFKRNKTDTLIKQLQHELHRKDKVLKMVKDKLRPIIKHAERNQLERKQVENLRKLLNEAEKQLKNTDKEETTEEEMQEKSIRTPDVDEETLDSNSIKNILDFERSEASTPSRNNTQEPEEHSNSSNIDEQQLHRESMPYLLHWFLQNKRTQTPNVDDETSTSDSGNAILRLQNSEAGRNNEQEDGEHRNPDEQGTHKELVPFLIEWFRQDKSTQTPDFKSDSKSGFDRSDDYTFTLHKNINVKQVEEEGGNNDQQGARKRLLSTPLKEQRQNTGTNIPNGVGGASETGAANEEQITQKEIQDKSKPIPDTEEDIYSGNSPDLRLVLLGRAGSVNSAVGDILGSENSEAGTSTPAQGYKIRQGNVGDKSLTVLETPDELFSELPQEEIRHCARLSAPGPHAFLIVIPVKEPTGKERGMLEKMEEMFGEKCWRNTIILLTVTDEGQKDRVEEFIRSGNQEVQRLVEKCGNRFHCLNVKENRDGAQVPELLKKIEKMLKDNPERFYSREIYQQVREMERRVMDIIIRKTQEKYLKCLIKEKGIASQKTKKHQDVVNKKDETPKNKIAEMEKRYTQDLKMIADIYDGEGWIEDQNELMKLILPEVHAMLWDLQRQLRGQAEPKEHVKNKQPEPQTPNKTERSEKSLSNSQTTKL